MPFSDVFNILLFIIPGFITNRVFTNHFPGVKDSDLGRIVSSIIYSLLCLGVACFIFKICGSDFTLESGKIISFEVFALLLISYLFGWLLILLENLKRKYFKSKIREQSVWAYLNKQREDSWVVVHLKSNDKYLGWMKNWKFDPNNPNEFDFLIADARKVDSEWNEIYKIDGEGVYFVSSEISHIEYIS